MSDVRLPDILAELEQMPEPGQIITFYSYKGGTGRTMALANIACLLARRPDTRRGVLMIDWDLEAPGLHRFFRDYLKTQFLNASDLDTALDDAPGLIDLFRVIEQHLRASDEAKNLSKDREPPREVVDTGAMDHIFDAIDMNAYILKTDVPGVSLLKAGRFDDNYPGNINSFDWNTLYERSPELLRTFAERMAAEYDYVLVDSRTGLTDTSGICTVLLPNKLVVVFTPNRQSILGVSDVLKRVFTRRNEEWSDIRRFSVFPVASRVEKDDNLRQSWRDIYQARFENMFEANAALFKDPSTRDYDLNDYFNRVLIQHSVVHSFGELIAVLGDNQDSLSLAATYRRLEESLCTLDYPWSPAIPDSAQTVNVAPILPSSALMEDNRFFLWRKEMKSALQTWLMAQQAKTPGYAAYLLTGQVLTEAEDWLTKRGTDLNRREREYILSSLLQRSQLDLQTKVGEQQKKAKEQQERVESLLAREKDSIRLVGILRSFAFGVFALLLVSFLVLFGMQRTNQADRKQFASEKKPLEDRIRILSLEKENAVSKAKNQFIKQIADTETAIKDAKMAKDTALANLSKAQLNSNQLNQKLKAQQNTLIAVTKKRDDLKSKFDTADKARQVAEAHLVSLQETVAKLNLEATENTTKIKVREGEIKVLKEQLDKINNKQFKTK